MLFRRLLRLRCAVPRKLSASLEAWDKGWNPPHVICVRGSELGEHLFLFPVSEPGIHDNQDWKHYERRNGRPLKEETKHDDHKGYVLRMPDCGVRPRRRELVSTLSGVQHLPRRGEQDVTRDDEDHAEKMQRVRVRISLPPEQGMPEVAGVVGIGIDAGEFS